MKLTVEFPSVSYREGTTGVARLAQAIEQIGYDHIDMFDHVVMGYPIAGRPPARNHRGSASRYAEAAAVAKAAPARPRPESDCSVMSAAVSGTTTSRPASSGTSQALVRAWQAATKPSRAEPVRRSLQEAAGSPWSRTRWSAAAQKSRKTGIGRASCRERVCYVV